MPKTEVSNLSLFFFCILFLSSTTSVALINPIKIYSATQIKVYQGQSIQEAINSAKPGDTIFVYNGTYHEHLEINKTISLVGENPANTILDGDGEPYLPIIRVLASNVTLSKLTIRNTSPEPPPTPGIVIKNVKNANITNNIITKTYHGISLENSSYCNISNNLITKNFGYGIYLPNNSSENLFIGNNVYNNPTGVLIYHLSCQNNTFYHNNFVDNSNQADNHGKFNLWNAEYPIGGNYWSSYVGQDLYMGPNQDIDGSDGIGDKAYTESLGINDTYPLMNHWGSKPPIADFTYSPANPKKNETITFDASPSHDPDGSITTYEWDFDDGNKTFATTPIIMHRYLEDRNYSVTLTVTDSYNLTDSTTREVAVQKWTSILSMEVYPSTIEIGGSATINGTLWPAKETNITIKSRFKGEPIWQNLTITTNVGGIYQYIWTPKSIGEYELQAVWEGDENTSPAESPIAGLNVTKRRSTLTIYVDPPISATVGSNITIWGRIRPIQENLNITISYQPLFGSWNTIAMVKTDFDGNYIYIFKASWPGDEQTFRIENTSGFITINKIKGNITISINPPGTATLGSNITISGSITPQRANENITIYFQNQNGDRWNVTAHTNATGHYTFLWNPTNVGTYNVRSSWQGDEQATSANSQILSVTIQSKEETPSFYYTIGILLVIIVSIVVILLLRKR